VNSRIVVKEKIIMLLDRHVALLLAMTVEKYAVFARHCNHSWQQQNIPSLRDGETVEAIQFIR